jgi:hypothetical protein
MAAPNVVSEICARCDGPMVAKPDAVGRIRLRCPKCDGVSPPRPRHPDDAMIPQGLVHLVGALPPVAPGQLRCQRCARGVKGDRRFCAQCRRQIISEGAARRTFKPKLCKEPSCRQLFTPTASRNDFCEDCR